MLRRLYDHHVLANATFVLVLALGVTAYLLLPRQQDPTINFNWIDITTVLPGATPRDVEHRVTNPLERAIEGIGDVRFTFSTSREGVSTIVVRFEEIGEAEFKERVADLRREIRATEEELPDEAEDPDILEVTTANAFPTATVVVASPGGGEQLRTQAQTVREDLKRLEGVDRILVTGMTRPQLQVRFDPARVEALDLAPGDLTDTVRRYFRDRAAGDVQIGGEGWLVSVEGTSADPTHLGRVPVETAGGEIALDDLATVRRGRSEAEELVRFRGHPAVMLGVAKDPGTNTLALVDRLRTYAEQRNALTPSTGARVVVADDRTEITREALTIMQNNLLIGLAFVLIVTWLFLGTRIAFFTVIAIPFILAGTIGIVWLSGFTLNVTVLLGIVIALGMIVDDAVVIVEAIYYRLERGLAAMEAAIGGLREVFAPVSSAVGTTIAAFLPLMLTPGIFGQFMQVAPLVVTTALLISLVEAYWILPAHIVGAGIDLARPSRVQATRSRLLRRVRSIYTRWLGKAIRRPVSLLGAALLLVGLAAAAVATETGIRRDFFAADPIRLFYVNIDMPVGTPLEQTLAQTRAVERRVRADFRPAELRSTVAYAGRQFTETAPVSGDHQGQVLVVLRSRGEGMRAVDEITDALRPRVRAAADAGEISFLTIAGGPPAAKPISIKVRGDGYDELRRAVAELKGIMARREAIRDVTDNDASGRMTLGVRVDAAAAHRAGVSPARVRRTVRLMVDGELATEFEHAGEEHEVWVRPHRDGAPAAIDEVLAISLPTADGAGVPLAELVDTRRERGFEAIHHYDFRRAITVEANVDPAVMDTVEANRWIREQWSEIRSRHPDVSLDFTGRFEDIWESIRAMAILFVLGVGLMYLILGTQFRSYFQPLMVLVTIPPAFTGVTAGLIVTANPLSLFTLYGVVALAGIAVNASIVLVSAANERLERGMSLMHATLYAARRRVVPILITSLTTIAGLFSLAVGLGGESLLWGPVATAIVWGLAVSTLMTLFVVPTLYALTMRRSWRLRSRA